MDVTVDAYDEQGARMPVSAIVHLDGGEVRVIRLEKNTDSNELSWVRVEARKERAESLVVEADTERLAGNIIERLTRHDDTPSTRSSWFTLIGTDPYLYMVNVGDRPVKLTICRAQRARQDSCNSPEGIESQKRLTLKPKQTFLARLGSQGGPYLIARFFGHPTVISSFLAPAQGMQRRFSTESTLSFEELAVKPQVSSSRSTR